LNTEQKKQAIYRHFSEKMANQLPIFLQSWWLDAVCDAQNWSANLSISPTSGEVEAALVYHFRQKYFFSMILMPPFTPFAGVWFDEKIIEKNNLKKTSAQNFIKNKLNDLIENLPKVDFYFQKFHYNLTDWQPFFWKGFQQTTHFTYTLALDPTVEMLLKNCNKNTQRNIQKSNQFFDAKILEMPPPQYKADFLEKMTQKFAQMNAQTFKRQGKNAPVSTPKLQQIIKAIYENQAGALVAAFPKNTPQTVENIVAMTLIVWDKKTTYYLGGGATDFARENGATFGLLWESILYSKNKNIQIFDFEGSMLQNVEKIFRNFGATQQPYHRIWRTRNRFFEVLNLFFKIK
jgi:lipid II:glycine glycyltransferase (peptidoglycan interpeptide bridge formation enzyme)